MLVVWPSGLQFPVDTIDFILQAVQLVFVLRGLESVPEILQLGAQAGQNFRLLPNQEIHMDVIRILLAIVLPPLGVFLQVGIGLHFWVNILLTLLGYVPGIIHAIWVIVKK